MATGYIGMAEATAKAWRNGWFHTGDAFRQDSDGSFFFIDRIKDYIRRRGENISSVEVEQVVSQFPSVEEAAVVGVPSPFGEDDVLVAVVTRPGEVMEPEELIRFLLPKLPHFMVPRYVRVVGVLPRTATAKIQKHVLREQGVPSGTYDRELTGSRAESGER